MLLVPVYLMAAEKVNLNTATLEELMTLERIGPKYAQRIIDYRVTHGPFEKIEDIMKVKGIGPKTFDANKDVITVE
ncbi:ComE operon protein 1 [subsurface metagenome]